VEFVAFDIEGAHFGVSDLDPLGIGPRIKLAVQPETGLGRRCGDQFDHGETTCQGLAAPSLGDVTEQSVLDFVPF
jgi:hypothetical protein